MGAAAPASERTTPGQGTPEREALEKRYQEYDSASSKDYGEIVKLRQALERTKRWSKKYDQIKARIEKIEERIRQRKTDNESLDETLRRALSSRSGSPSTVTRVSSSSETGPGVPVHPSGTAMGGHRCTWPRPLAPPTTTRAETG